MNKKDFRFFELARKLSYKSDYYPHKLGAVIVKGTNIVGTGYNKSKTHPKSNNKYRTTHAELAAILNSEQEDLINCEIYLYRETKSKQLANSFPCAYCQKLLDSVSIKHIHYTHETGFKTKR